MVSNAENVSIWWRHHVLLNKHSGQYQWNPVDDILLLLSVISLFTHNEVLCNLPLAYSQASPGPRQPNCWISYLPSFSSLDREPHLNVKKKDDIYTHAYTHTHTHIYMYKFLQNNSAHTGLVMKTLYAVERHNWAATSLMLQGSLGLQKITNLGYRGPDLRNGDTFAMNLLST